MNPHSQADLWRDALRDMRAEHPVRFEHSVEVGDGALLKVSMVTVDSRDGVTPITPTKTVCLPAFTTTKAARDLLRGYMRNMVCHELDEWLLVGDLRPWYPHGGWE